MTGAEVLGTLALFCIGMQAYQYVGYPALLALLVRLRGRRRPAGGGPLPSSTLLICAYNEAGVIAAKLENSLALDPAPDEIIVVDDGSSDGTAEIARRYEGRAVPVRVLTGLPRGGKAEAMNRGVKEARGDVIVFSDASEIYDRAALRHLLTELSDPSVAVVSGSHRIKAPVDGNASSLSGNSEGLYWRYEEAIRRNESDLGSTVASVGSMLALRREEWRPLPPGTVNDDAYITMTVLARGHNVRFAPLAVSWEEATESSGDEARRRKRISAGRMKLITRREVWPLRRPWVLAAFLSHKVLRLGLPILMVVGGVANLAAVVLDPSRVLLVFTLAAQVLGLGLALVGCWADRSGRRLRLPHLAWHILRANLAGLEAYRDLLGGRSFVKWDKPSR